MSNNSYVKQLLAQVGDGGLALTPSVVECVAEELESALVATSNTSLRELSQSLGNLVAARLAQLPEEARVQLGISDSSSVIESVFALGQLEFAHLLAAQAAERKVSDEFVSSLSDRRFIGYIELLKDDDMTNVELANKLSVEEETVSRNLRKLRGLGVTDFRREGKNVVNFLTPAARSIISIKPSSTNEAKKLSREDLLSSLTTEIPDFLKTPLNLSPHGDSSYILAA